MLSCNTGNDLIKHQSEICIKMQNIADSFVPYISTFLDLTRFTNQWTGFCMIGTSVMKELTT